MNIAVIDDDKKSAQQIKTMLKSFAEEKLFWLDIKLFHSGEDFMAAFEPNGFNIIFMDIYMDKMSGIETAKAIRESDNNCLIIFLTTSLEHMPDAFSCHAFEYVVKPINRERLFSVMDDALKIVPDFLKYIEFQCKRKKVTLLIPDIVSAVSNGHYLIIQDKNSAEYSARMTLTEFTGLIHNDSRFLIINKGIMVNMDYIETIKGNSCILTDSRKFPIKVRECAAIEQTWLNYNFSQIHIRQDKKIRGNENGD